MTLSPTTNLLQHPAFCSLSEAGTRRLEQKVAYLNYRVGQPISEAGVLPAQVLVVLKGQARLLVHQLGRLTTLEKLDTGAVVGLASLLRAAPCEQVTAATEVLAAALPDELIVELYASEPGFRTWCDQTLWPAELHALLLVLWQRTARPEGALSDIYRKAREQAHTHLISADASKEAGREPATQLLFIASDNAPGHTIGNEYDRDLPPRPQGPFPLRLISVPLELFQVVNPAPSGNANALGEPAASEAPAFPHQSSQNLGQPMADGPLKLVRGEGPLEETLACMQMVCAQMQLPFRRDAIERVVRDQVRRGKAPNLQTLGQLAANLGLHVTGTRIPASAAGRLQTPAILPWDQGFAVVIASDQKGLSLASPREGLLGLSPERITELYPEGLDVLLLERSNVTPTEAFGASWFWPAIRRHRGVLMQVLVAGFVVQLFTLANPLLIQVIIDKVINQRSLDTLQVLGFALVVVTLLEGVLGSLKTFLFAETTNRIDLRLGSEVIDHLLRLPLSYFDRRPVGELGTRVGELEKIRSFLTGQALTTVLDAMFSVVYIVVMVIYSWLLTLIALSVVPIQAAITLLGAPLFRRQFRQGAEANAKTQSHLVEVLTGIQTVKAQNVEMVSRWKWQELYSRYIAHTFDKTLTGTAVNQTSQVLQKLSQLLVLWVGASLVLDGKLTLGQLIAFRIISSYVTQPILRLSSIWQNVQELKVSFERLADVVDTPQESDATDQAKIPLPPIHGGVRFESVTFSFSRGVPPAVSNVTLDIPQGTFVGIVGQSGSGKSTLMKLLPRLYSPDTGRILIDGYDIDKVELYSLRRQIGIVPQDPLLFAGTVNDNIGLTDPEASSDDLVEAAQVACAHEFIMELPAGYSTPVGERGAGLSGGQRQRIAIARTLLSRPKLLVMDEATSALDYDTERRVCENLRQAMLGATVFFITHRLSTIRNADRIVMMHQGVVAEQGTHDELMELRGRYYALYRQQEAS